jgi:hypothetical protein
MLVLALPQTLAYGNEIVLGSEFVTTLKCGTLQTKVQQRREVQ